MLQMIGISRDGAKLYIVCSGGVGIVGSYSGHRYLSVILAIVQFVFGVLCVCNPISRFIDRLTHKIRVLVEILLMIVY